WQPIVWALAFVSLLFGAVVALMQRDVKRMMAYSSINHAGFILLGLQAATARGVSASLYYLFAYTFMVIGTFAVVTVLGGEGDGDHDLSRYRGLAGRQPVLALCLAVLLLAQAGAPFTTGLWAKLQVVLASVDAGSVPLAAVAMVTAALAAFFYLRVAVLMYTGGAERDAEEPEPLAVGSVGPASPRFVPDPPPAPPPIAPPPAPGRPLWTGTGQELAVTGQLNAALLLDPVGAPVSNGHAPVDGHAADAPALGDATDVGDEGTPAEETVPDQPTTTDGSKVPVPAATAVVIGLCVAVTVVFGVFPAPLVDLAHKATLLFFP
ncbi:MAG TPA: proton-conducting transporter membrane subunit, partial [Acidimicrobiales bacterium]|nr:proton-conducting transporter membrane subunit [Acidimicrobiales bacterium]